MVATTSRTSSWTRYALRDQFHGPSHLRKRVGRNVRAIPLPKIRSVAGRVLFGLLGLGLVVANVWFEVWIWSTLWQASIIGAALGTFLVAILSIPFAIIFGVSGVLMFFAALTD